MMLRENPRVAIHCSMTNVFSFLLYVWFADAIVHSTLQGMTEDCLFMEKVATEFEARAEQAEMRQAEMSAEIVRHRKNDTYL